MQQLIKNVTSNYINLLIAFKPFKKNTAKM
jgi:hypothetical protein